MTIQMFTRSVLSSLDSEPCFSPGYILSVDNTSFRPQAPKCQVYDVTHDCFWVIMFVNRKKNETGKKNHEIRENLRFRFISYNLRSPPGLVVPNASFLPSASALLHTVLQPSIVCSDRQPCILSVNYHLVMSTE